MTKRRDLVRIDNTTVFPNNALAFFSTYTAPSSIPFLVRVGNMFQIVGYAISWL